MAHTGRSSDIHSVCIAPAFRQVVRSGAPWPILFTCLCLFTPQLLAASAFSVFALAVFPCSHGRPQCMRLPLGTTELNQQVSASTRESHDAAPSSSVSCPQVTLSSTHPQVQMDPTRTITNDLLSATLVEAATQRSFAAFLYRCIFVNASPPPQLPVPISGCRYAAFLTFAALRVLDQSPSLRIGPQAPTNISRRPVESSMRLVHCIHWQHGPRHLAQQGHLRARPYGFRLQGRLRKQRYVGYGPTNRSRSAATPFTYWNTDGYILLCTHPQCRGEET